MKSRRIIMAIFIVLVAASIIYGLMDHRKYTTSSDKAYQACLRGEEYMYRLYQREALDEFEQALKLDPNFAMAHARAAMMYKSFSRDAEYEAAKQKALGQIGRLKEKERLLINLWFAQADRRQGDVEKHSAELIKKYPNSLEALEYETDIFFRDRKFSEAIGQIEKLIEKYPNHAPSYNLLGYSYFYVGEYDKALASIDKYSSLAQDQANPHDSHGELLLYMGRYDEALTQFRMADSIKPGLHFVMEHIGSVYRAKGMYRDAIGAYLKAAELSLNRETKANIEASAAVAYFESGQTEKAVEVLKETVAREPENLRSQAILGGIYAEKGRMEDALIQLGVVRGLTAQMLSSPAYKSVPAVNIKSAEQYLAGAIDMAKGDYRAASEKFSQLAREMSPSDNLLYASLWAESYIKAQLPDSAIAILTDALTRNPNNERCLRTLAQAYGQAGKKDAQQSVLTRYLTVMKDADEGAPGVQIASAMMQ
jgi:tetratricopeptide (TPR) repeat protein